MKYLGRRGKIYQFERAIRKDLQPIIGQPAWRESLFTDSETEAEALCRKRTVETDEIIAQAKAGTLRQFTDDAIEDLAIRWSIEFQLAYEATIAYELFPDYVPIGEPATPDAPSKIFQSRKAIEAEVTDWAASQVGMPTLGSTDWQKLIDECIDNYLVSNPHLPGDWMAVLEEHGFDRATIADGQVKVVPRPRNVPVRNRLLSMFDEFL